MLYFNISSLGELKIFNHFKIETLREIFHINYNIFIYIVPTIIYVES